MSDTADLISRGRTDLVFDLLRNPDGRKQIPGVLTWFVYYNDVTALRAVLEAGLDLTGLDLGRELGHAAFFGHWKVADFLLAHGADVNWKEPDTAETPLHSALCKAGRPHYANMVKLLLDAGADPNAHTIPGRETGAFMRDVRTRGETPLHRAAAFGDETMIQLLLDKGADRRLRDANGDTPLSWASWHLRPGSILALLAYPPHTITPKHVAQYTGDHGRGWGGMEARTLGDYLPLKR
jgi:uncharacterized protein